MPKLRGLYKNYLIRSPHFALKPELGALGAIYRLSLWQDGQKWDPRFIQFSLLIALPHLLHGNPVSP